MAGVEGIFVSVSFLGCPEPPKTSDVGQSETWEQACRHCCKKAPDVLVQRRKFVPIGPPSSAHFCVSDFKSNHLFLTSFSARSSAGRVFTECMICIPFIFFCVSFYIQNLHYQILSFEANFLQQYLHFRTTKVLYVFLFQCSIFKFSFWYFLNLPVR